MNILHHWGGIYWFLYHVGTTSQQCVKLFGNLDVVHVSNSRSCVSQGFDLVWIVSRDVMSQCLNT